MGGLPYESVKSAAMAQINATPFYKSKVLETRWYDGYFKAAPGASASKLALLSDDGTSVWIDGVKVLDRAGQGQGFEQFDSTFVTLAPYGKTSFTAGQVYHLRLQYTNTAHLSNDDVDGISLWAFDGGGDIVPKPDPLKFTFALGKTALCAGGLASAPHQTHVDVTVKNPDGTSATNKVVALSVDTTLPGSTAPLSATDPDADLRASLSSAAGTTDSTGTVHTLLTSSLRIGATAVVKATVGEDTGQSPAVTMEDADGDMGIDTDELVADGQSTANLYRTFSYNEDSVVGHNVNFYIESVKDENGQPVQPAADGTFPGYGSIVTTQGVSDDDGIAYGTYTAGTLVGDITFGSEDTSVIVNEQPVLTSLKAKARFCLVSNFGSFHLIQSVKPRVGSRKITSPKQNARRPIRVSLNFCQIKDKLGNSPTPYYPSLHAVSALNSVWWPLAQIHFVYLNEYVHTLDRGANVIDQGSMDSIDTGVQFDLQKDNRKLSNLTVYFCVQISSTTTPTKSGFIGGVGHLGGPWLFMQNVPKAYGSLGKNILCHEAGHNLNLLHIAEAIPGTTTEDPSFIYLRPNLMYWEALGGLALNEDQRNKANKYANSTWRTKK